MRNFNETTYKQLTATERFKLALAAFSRGDDDEIAQLKRTCPHKNYKMMDLDYFGKIEGITWVITQFSEICERSYHYIMLCEAYISMLIFINEQPQFMVDIVENNVGILVEERIKHISNLKSAHQALREFCEENNLNYLHVIGWAKTSPEFSRYKDYLWLKIGADQKFTDYVKQKLFSIWQSYVLN